ncbi:helix-turn-helix domain-containing protein [Candidatus Micrarchaeota archaeon]|nr:helix-turn-helix domain-containing protein [Candidatus Micrarchaeota archaeon]
MVNAGAPAPEAPEFPEDKIVVDDEDMEFVAAPRRGRPRKEVNSEQLTKVLQLYFVEKMSMRKVADVVGVSHMSIYRMLSDPTVEVLL